MPSTRVAANRRVDLAVDSDRSQEAVDSAPVAAWHPLSGSESTSWARASDSVWAPTGVIVVLGAVDWTWADRAGLTFSGWPAVILAVAFLGTIGMFYAYSGRDDRLADSGTYGALWVAFSIAGAIFTYVAATLRMPLRDAELARVDAAFGFDWYAWNAFISAHHALKLVLAAAYSSMLAQIVGSLLYFAHTRQRDRNQELLTIAMAALIVTTLISAVFPGLGPYVAGHQPVFSIVLEAIRKRSETTFMLGNLQGIVTMPSYHTVIAILLTYTHRPPSRSFPVMTILCGLMLLGVPSEGNHYLADIIAGGAVAVGCIIAMRLGSKDQNPRAAIG